MLSIPPYLILFLPGTMAHNFARFSLFFLYGSLFFSHIQKESRFRPCSGCSSLCKISFCCRGSVAVAAVLGHKPVLAAALGFLHTAAHTVEKRPLQRAVGVAYFGHAVCILDLLTAFLSGHQITLFHVALSSQYFAACRKQTYSITFGLRRLCALLPKRTRDFVGECVLTFFMFCYAVFRFFRSHQKPQ